MTADQISKQRILHALAKQRPFFTPLIKPDLAQVHPSLVCALTRPLINDFKCFRLHLLPEVAQSLSDFRVVKVIVPKNQSISLGKLDEFACFFSRALPIFEFRKVIVPKVRNYKIFHASPKELKPFQLSSFEKL